MNFISPELLMQNAIKNRYYKKPDDIYPPTEKDFDNSIYKFVNNKNNLNNQRLNELQDEGKIRYQDPEQLREEELNLNSKNVKRPAETFYIPRNSESFDLRNIPTNIESILSRTSSKNINPQILIVIIIVMLMIIIYLYCKVETLQTLNKMYEQNLIVTKKSNI